MGLGGPVWHASIAKHDGTGAVMPAGREAVIPPLADYWAHAYKALRGVGNAGLGEWTEVGQAAVHLRRRLSAVEQAQRGLVVRDVRGTPEADELLAPVRHLLPAGYQE